ncbi:MAG: sigma-70 family RNA polymerase sigma factor [Phycisphaerales bacterium]|nr:MAG: sigma-70 family RNA polymerase sigma factor [Phycisphaerales bacterium]
MRRQRRTSFPVDLHALRSREPHAIEPWFLEHADALYTFVFYRVGKDEELATDVVQDVFVTALDKIDRYDPTRGGMFAWLTYVARNCIRRALERRGRYAGYAAYWEEIDQKLLAACKELATAPLPEEVLTRRETTELVHVALSNLPENYQRALRQRYYEQWPLQAIARSEGVTEGAVKSLLYRARQAFKTAFEMFADTLDDQVPTRGAVR